MKRVLSLILLFGGTLLMAQQTNPILEAMNNYDYERAILLINHEKPTKDLLFYKAKALKGLSRNEEALNTFKQIEQEEPHNQQALIEIAECYKILTKFKEALSYYQKVIDLNPTNKYVRLQYISLLCSQEQFQEAFGESSQLAETDSSAVVLHLQAQSLEGMNEMLGAIGCYHLIQDKYPTDYLAAAKLGQLYTATEKYEYAIEATEKYRQNDTTNVIVNRQNAMAYCMYQDYKTAVKRYEVLAEQGDRSFLTCYYLGVSYYAIERYYEAHDFLDAALKYGNPTTNLLYYLGRTCAKTSWKKEGVAYLKQAIELTIPSDTTMIKLYRGLANCCELAQMSSEQIAALREQYKYDRNNHVLLYEIATVYRWLRDENNVERSLEAFLKTKPRDVSPEKTATLNARGEVELGLQNYYNAAEKWMKDLQKEKFFKEGAPQ